MKHKRKQPPPPEPPEDERLRQLFKDWADGRGLCRWCDEWRNDVVGLPVQDPRCVGAGWICGSCDGGYSNKTS